MRRRNGGRPMKLWSRGFLVVALLVAGGAVVWLTRSRASVALGVRTDGVMVVGGRFP